MDILKGIGNLLCTEFGLSAGLILSKGNFANFKKIGNIGEQMTHRLKLVVKKIGQNMDVQNAGPMLYPVLSNLDAITGYHDFFSTVDLAK